ncbi:MAG: hypothetical protein JO032_11555 [Alphaproteobacteria bacterium]|nr:hypothetical protein [Alphaproteobacteria bacterium]
MQRSAIAACVAAAGLIAGCDTAHTLGGKINPDTLSLADRCADIMQRAMPFADIDIGQRSSEGSGVRKILARVEGSRDDLPKDVPAGRELGVECEFTDGMLTGFRWTKGGPAPEH